MQAELVLLISFALVVVTGSVIVLAGVMMRGKAIEMAHKERLAMIERGMTPPPSLVHHVTGERPHGRVSGGRALDLGIVIIGFGLALGMIIGFAGGAGDTAVGLGGAIVVIGAALIARAKLGSSSTPDVPPPPPPEIPR